MSQKTTDYKNVLPNLHFFLEKNSDIQILFEDYYFSLQDSLKYKKIAEFEDVFSKRDSFISALIRSEDFFKVMQLYEDEKMENYPNIKSDKLYYEMENIGIITNWAEGMMFDISPAPIMMQCIEKNTPRDYYLYVYIKNNFSYFLNGEYPYTNLETLGKILVAVEELYTKYPKTTYYCDVFHYFYSSLLAYVDIHAVISENDYPSFIVGGYTTDAYPGLTNIESHKDFLKNNPNSRFYNTINSIVNNYSRLEYETDMIYYIEVPLLNEDNNLFYQCTDVWEYDNKSFKMAVSSWMTYVWNGIDIAHVLQMPKEKGSVDYIYFCVYRFYHEKTKAEEALKLIKAKIPSAVVKNLEIEKYMY
jgi:hypothetical protein